jgi:hypothetical protein
MLVKKILGVAIHAFKSQIVSYRWHSDCPTDDEARKVCLALDSESIDFPSLQSSFLAEKGGHHARD